MLDNIFSVGIYHAKFENLEMLARARNVVSSENIKNIHTYDEFKLLTNFVEHPEVIADRLERVAADVGDPTRVLAGTDCGFDTSAGMGRVATDVVWAKLRALAEGARIASDRLMK